MLGAAPDSWDVSVPGVSPHPAYRRPIADALPSRLLAARHIGPRRARRLLNALGPDWQTLLDAAPERVFGTLRGIGPRQASEAADSWRSTTTTGGARPPNRAKIGSELNSGG